MASRYFTTTLELAGLTVWYVKDRRQASAEGSAILAICMYEAHARRVIAALESLDALENVLCFDRFFSRETFSPLTAVEWRELLSAIESVAPGGWDRLHAGWARDLARVTRADYRMGLTGQRAGRAADDGGGL